MKRTYIILCVFGAIVAIVCLIFGLGLLGIGYTKTIGKGQANANRQVFEQTQSYVEGKRQQLTKYRLEYLTTKDSVSKEAIRETILMDFANFDANKLPVDLQQFLNQLKQ